MSKPSKLPRCIARQCSRQSLTASQILGLAYRGDTYEALDSNSDSVGTRSALSNGLQGWIAAILVELQTLPQSALTGNESASAPRLQALMSLPLPRRFSQVDRSDAQLSRQDMGMQPAYALQRERHSQSLRWQASTLGALAAALAIALGNIIALVGALGRSE